MRTRPALQRDALLIGSVVVTAAGLVFGAAAMSQVTPPPTEAAKPKTAVAAPSPSPAEEAVRNLVAAVSKAYNQADAKAVAALFTDDAAVIDNAGVEIRGREAIMAHYAGAFAEGPTAKVVGSIANVRFLTPDVSSIGGEFQLTDEAGTVLSGGRFSMLALRNGDQWRLSELRDYSVETAESPSNYEHLKELEWIVGDWVDEGQDIKVNTNVRWAENENFLVRTYALQIGGEPATSGTQWIGWDPQSQRIRSWVFDSEGGFGEGTWTRAGDSWIIKASGVLRDGKSTSATQILQQINKDAAKFHSLDRIVGDEVIAESSEVLMVRKPPEPAARPAPAAGQPK
jgi:uncharacterized protein (TIGR02246 family)